MHWRTDLPPAAGPLDNPLKGWAAYCFPDSRHCLPVSMAYFYHSWRELEPEPGRFAFDEWEKEWDSPTARGKHAVLRLYLDYPGKVAGVPDWVRAKGVKMTPYTDFGGGLSPDYDDPRLLEPLLRFIAALGKRYNGDPRVAFVAVGTLGFWGEWHTFPRKELFPPEATQRKVVDAYRGAFPDKGLLARNAGNPVTGNLPWIGYHDDFFPADTDTGKDWEFLPSIRRAGRAENWRVAPIGAEMVPNEASKYLGPEWKMTRKATEASHLSWIGPYCPALEPKPSPEFLRRGEEMVRRMGYEFRLKSVIIDNSGSARPIVRIDGENRGIAPFYYPWPVELAVIDNTNQVIQRFPAAGTDIRRWQPGAFSFTAPLALLGKPDASLRLALGIIDPWTKQPRIRFANSLEMVNGWSILVSLKPS